MLFKGLTSYPVFVLTLASLLAISYLAISIFDHISQDHIDLIHDNIFYGITYRCINNTLYLETSNPTWDYILELIIFNNGTKTLIKIPRSIGFLYGPIKLYNNVDQILFIAPGQTPSIIDRVVFEKPVSSISRVFQGYYPPSILINYNHEELKEVSSPYSLYEFYILKPVTMVRNSIVEKNTTYALIGEELKVLNKSIQAFIVYNGTIDPEVISSRYYLILDTYGEAIEYRRYILNLYPRKTYTYLPDYIFLSQIAYSRIVTLTTNISLPSISVEDQKELVKINITHRILSISIRDIYGFQQTALINVSYKLILSNSTIRKTIDLGYRTFYSTETPVIELYNYTILGGGDYTVSLNIVYRVSLITIPYLPIRVSIGQYVYGGLSYKVFSTYSFDEIRVRLDNNEIYIYPIENDTSAEITVYSSIASNYTIIYIRGQGYFNASTYSLEYSGRNKVYVKTIIYPKTVIWLNQFTGLEAYGVYSREYILLENGTHKLIGLFFVGDKASIELFFYPHILFNTTEYIVLDERQELIAGLRKDHVHLIVVNNTVLNITDPEYHGFIYIKHVGYEHPLLITNTSLPVKIGIKYIDGYESFFMINDSIVLPLRNTIVREISMEVNLSDRKGYLLYSTLKGYIGFFDVDEGLVFEIRSIREINIFGKIYRVVVVNNNDLIIYNTR
ncbi:MAG: hypothetical protein B6U89_03940 [Desulfurococcales archaeon ex4484_58]|nr:MAG: hypothetical protein B6U89_03940 [Desulfurococcales archaeon ex4484_58]